jgi:hypothetical protein
MLWASMQTSQIETGALGPEHEVNKMNEYQLPDPYDVGLFSTTSVKSKCKNV